MIATLTSSRDSAVYAMVDGVDAEVGDDGAREREHDRTAEQREEDACVMRAHATLASSDEAMTACRRFSELSVAPTGSGFFSLNFHRLKVVG